MFGLFKSEETKTREENFRIKGYKEFEEILKDLKKFDQYLYDSNYVVKARDQVIDSYRSGKSLYTHKPSGNYCRIVEICYKGKNDKNLF